MDKEYSCFFTGHRIIAGDKLLRLEQALRDKVKSLIENKGVVDFIAGGAIGFDTLAARVVLDLKEEYSDIKLHIYLPCYGSMKRWNSAQRFVGRMILSECSDYIYVTKDEYTDGCMQKRNRKMADDARYCIAYCERKNSGTGSTVVYARSVGDYVYDVLGE